MNQVILALGSNIEPRQTYMERAESMLQEHTAIDVVHTSSIYETAPVGYMDQGPFLNKVVKIQTTLHPLSLLDYCQSIEKELGRKREIRWGPRTIDVDILFYNQESMDTERLILPHPRITERAFVLIPLQEVCPRLLLKNGEKYIEEIIQELPPTEKEGVVAWQQTNGGEESKLLEN